MHIRKTTGLSPNYSTINREERNYAALLFAALCLPENAQRFLTACGYHQKINDEFGIYFEYAYLRDLWYTISDEAIKKSIIRNHLKVKNIDAILNLPLKEINQLFGVSGQASTKFLQYPGKWSVSKYHHHFLDNEDFLAICKFKWAFNIKPDIVIHLDKDHAICIEAKYESGEGVYPASTQDKKIFKARGLANNSIRQIELQDYMMQTLLGIQTDFLFLVPNPKNHCNYKVITWAEAFNCLDTTQMPAFAKTMIEIFQKSGYKVLKHISVIDLSI